MIVKALTLHCVKNCCGEQIGWLSTVEGVHFQQVQKLKLGWTGMVLKWSWQPLTHRWNGNRIIKTSSAALLSSGHGLIGEFLAKCWVSVQFSDRLCSSPSSNPKKNVNNWIYLVSAITRVRKDRNPHLTGGLEKKTQSRKVYFKETVMKGIMYFKVWPI